MNGTLSLVCHKCTRESEIQAPTKEAAVEIAKARGWVMQDARYICPTCPATRVKLHDPIGVSVGFGLTHEQGQSMEMTPSSSKVAA